MAFSSRCQGVLYALSLCLAATLHAQETPSQMLNSQLPKWVRLSFDHRFRFEGYTGVKFQESAADRWFLNRLRINVTLKPKEWWTFTFQGQDARIFIKENPAGQNPFINKTDLRMAYTDLGLLDKSKVALRVGRQELIYGEERVIGAGNWGSVARTFDAAKVILRRGPWQVDLVSAAVVTPQLRGISHHLQGNNIHFAYARWTNLLPNTIFEPYFIWRVGRGNNDALAGIIHQDRRVPGFRLAGKLPASWDYVTEWLAQLGNVNNQRGYESIHAWAQHSMIRHTFEKVKYRPRLMGEFNYASGDRDPNDHRAGTYDQLFPTPHEKYGLADQVGWQNIQDVSITGEITVHKKLLLKAMVHDWYLAQARDGLYAAGGALQFRDATGNAGRHVGEEADLVAQFNLGPHYVGAGYGHIFPGEFLKRTTPGAHLNYVYLNVGYRF